MNPDLHSPGASPAGMRRDRAVAEADLITLLMGRAVRFSMESPESSRWRALRTARSLMALAVAPSASCGVPRPPRVSMAVDQVSNGAHCAAEPPLRAPRSTPARPSTRGAHLGWGRCSGQQAPHPASAAARPAVPGQAQTPPLQTGSEAMHPPAAASWERQQPPQCSPGSEACPGGPSSGAAR